MKPILFNTENVRAILDGRKSVTRRVVKGYALQNLELDTDESIIGVYDWDEGCVRPIMDYSPYRPGDILYVRETWDRVPVSAISLDNNYYYKSDGDLRPSGWRDKWRPSIHMPKEAARLFLRVTNVRVERLQDITERQAQLEGTSLPLPAQKGPEYADYIGGYYNAFSELWDSTIKKSDLPRYGWEANPFVWVIEFDRISKEAALQKEKS